MNLSILFEKDDFDEDATFLKIESETGYNELLVEVAFNNRRWFYNSIGMSSTGMMTNEMISFEELIPYEFESELREDPEEKKPYILNLNVKLFVDEKVIDSCLNTLYLKKSKDNILTPDDLHFQANSLIHNVTDFNEGNSVNTMILSDIQKISDPNVLKNIEELEIQIESSKPVNQVAIKLDMFSNYDTIFNLSETKSIDVNTKSTIRLNESLFELLDNSMSYEIRKREQLILNTEITYTDVATQEKCSRIQSHLIHNPWCVIMEQKVEKHIEVLKNVLNDEFPSWSGEVKDNELWTSFRIDDDEFQYGLKDKKIDLHLYLGEISYDHDFEDVFVEMQKINKTLDKKFKLIETDNYFNIKSQMSPSKLNETILSDRIKKMIAITELPVIVNVRDAYEE